MSSLSAAEAAGSVNVSHSFWHSVPFNILIACGVSFTAPGMWDALGGLGAGGAAEPYAVSAANALVYGLFSIVCVAAGAQPVGQADPETQGPKDPLSFPRWLNPPRRCR